MTWTSSAGLTLGLPRLPEVWTLTSYRIARALAPLVGADGARADDVEAGGNVGAAFGDMPIAGTLQAEDAAAAGSMVNEVGHLAGR